jgi:hypothetical protein
LSLLLHIEYLNHEGEQDHLKEQEKKNEHTTGKSGIDQEKKRVDWLKEVNLEQLCKEVLLLAKQFG